MSYDFSFDKKTLTFLLGGASFVGIMLFVTGLLVGASWKTEPTALAVVTTSPQQPPVAATTTTTAAATTATTPSTDAAPAVPTVPAEPVLKAEAATPPQAAAAPVAPSVPAAAPSPVKQSHSAAPVAESRRATALPPLREEAASDVKIIQRADMNTAETSDSSGLNQLAFSVQVGVFVDENAANLLVRQLQGRGYTPIILTANDDEARRWYAVRIGAYVNKTDATKAAANISAQEKIKAVVRPLGSL